jgi:hypothetical protein
VSRTGQVKLRSFGSLHPELFTMHLGTFRYEQIAHDRESLVSPLSLSLYNQDEAGF